MDIIAKTKLVAMLAILAGAGVLWYFGSGWIVLGVALMMLGGDIRALACVVEEANK